MDLGAVTGSGLFRKLTHIAPLRHTNVPKIFALVYLHFHSNLSNLHRRIMNFQLLAQSETLNANNVGFCLHLRFGFLPQAGSDDKDEARTEIGHGRGYRR
jgi:hypothetical protein